MVASSAEATPEPDPAQTSRYLFFDGEAPRQGGLRPENALLTIGTDQPQTSSPRINLASYSPFSPNKDQQAILSGHGYRSALGCCSPVSGKSLKIDLSANESQKSLHNPELYVKMLPIMSIFCLPIHHHYHHYSSNLTAGVVGFKD